MKKVDYSETFAACDLKIIDLIKYVSIEGQGHFLTLAQCPFIDEDLTFFSQKPLADFQPNFECKLVGAN